jgi:hypothetical protein
LIRADREKERSSKIEKEKMRRETERWRSYLKTFTVEEKNRKATKERQ